MSEKIKLSDLKYNTENPRKISAKRLQKLMNSIAEFTAMMYLRPIIVDENNVVLGGNQRLTALKALKFKDIPKEWVKVAENLTEEEKKRFIVTDNVSFGEWELDTLELQYTIQDLEWWGLDDLDFKPPPEEEKPKVKTKQDSSLLTCPHCGEQFEV